MQNHFELTESNLYNVLIDRLGRDRWLGKGQGEQKFSGSNVIIH